MDMDFVPLKGYEGIYSINRNGDIYSHDRIVSMKNGGRKTITGKILGRLMGSTGYPRVCLSKGIKRRYMNVHRLVAETFIENPNNFKEVNHKDENRANSHVSNLEWCDRLYNVRYGTGIKRLKESMRNNGRKIYQFTKDGSFVAEYRSIMDAVRTSSKTYSNCIRVYLAICRRVASSESFVSLEFRPGE